MLDWLASLIDNIVALVSLWVQTAFIWLWNVGVWVIDAFISWLPDKTDTISMLTSSIADGAFAYIFWVLALVNILVPVPPILAVLSFRWFVRLTILAGRVIVWLYKLIPFV